MPQKYKYEAIFKHIFSTTISDIFFLYSIKHSNICMQPYITYTFRELYFQFHARYALQRVHIFNQSRLKNIIFFSSFCVFNFRYIFALKGEHDEIFIIISMLSSLKHTIALSHCRHTFRACKLRHLPMFYD